MATPAFAQLIAGNLNECQTQKIFSHLLAQQFSEALQEQKRLLAAAPPSTDIQSRQYSICLRSNIGTVLGRLERDTEAIATLEDALKESLETLGIDHLQTLLTEFHMAVAYSRARKFDLSIPMLQRLRPRYIKAFGARSMRYGSVLQALSNDYHWIGNFKEAIPIDREVLMIAEAIARDQSNGLQQNLRDSVLGRAQYHLADSLRRSGQNSEALPLSQSAVRLLSSTLGREHPDVLDARLIEASVLRAIGEVTRALDIEGDAYAVARVKLGEDHPLTRKAKANLAATMAGTGNLAASIEIQVRQYNDLKGRRGQTDPETLLALSNLTSGLLDAGRLEDALPLLEDALRAVDQARASLQFDNAITIAWQSRWRQLVDRYLTVLLRMKRGADALVVAEHYKSQLLAERISIDAGESSLTPDKRVALQSIRSRIAEIDQAIALKRSLGQSAVNEEARRAALNGELGTVAGANHTLLGQLPSAKTPPAWVRRISEQEPKTVSISYSFVDSRLVALIHRDSRVSLANLGPAVEARRLIENHRLSGRELSLNPQEEAAISKRMTRQLAQLSDILIKPLAVALTGRSRVLISLDQELSHVPFDMLRIGEGRLIDTHEVALIPSLDIYASLLDRRQRNSELPRRAFLGVGGAEYRRVVLLAPNIVFNREVRPTLESMDVKAIAQALREQKTSITSAFLSHTIGPPDLPGSKLEVERIGLSFGANATVLTGQRATEQTVADMASTGELAKYRYVHFAAHGFLSDDEPALSAIVLGQVNRSPGTDGYITVAELGAMRFAADLVTISACDSGAGVSNPGEGLLGMAYGLFQAGTSATLLTLWPVNDKQAAELMFRFYSELASSKSLQEALAKAKRWGLSNGLSEAVVAAFVLHGV